METNQAKVYIAVFLAVVVLAALLVFFILNIHRYQRNAVKLYEQQVNIEVTTLENERRRISSDLHDDIGPMLSSVKLQLSSIDTGDEEDSETLHRIGGYVDDIMRKLREISHNLVPKTLLKYGLIEAIKQFAEDINKTGTLHIGTTFHIDATGLSPENEVHIYRIVVETVNNTIKHANASEFNIVLERKKKLSITLGDNGKGFNYHAMTNDKFGTGLKSMLSRVNLLGGDIFIDTKPGKGVIFTIEIPTPKPLST